MPVIVLTRHGQLWRKVQTSPGQLGAADKLIGNVLFEVIPLDELDRTIAYALEATHLVFVPRWQSLRKEDEIRYASYVNAFGAQGIFRYVIIGKAVFRPGFTSVSYYATERE